MSKKQYETEWSFSFDKVAEQISNTVNQAVNAFKDDEPVQMMSVNEEVRGATSAQVKIGFSAGESIIKALTASDNLFEADLTYYGDVEFEVSGEAERVIKLSQADVRVGRMVKNHKRTQVRWEVRLNPDVPMSLNITAPVGESNIDLTGLQVTELTYKGGVGQHHLNLSQSSTPYHARIDTGVGETHITVPQNTSVNLQVRGGIGETRIFVPQGVAIHLTASHGLGEITVPEELERLSGRGGVVGKNGVWQSAGYADATQKITIHFQGGVGDFKLIAK
ncbi:MAG TPA: LiaF-related protein [Aggregatilineales bacterium]|nr:LiaF-related protein [Aggregatilineales bacterium]